MSQRFLILIAIAIGLTASANTHAQRSPQTANGKPNVVLIITDDMAYGDIGSYGGRDAQRRIAEWERDVDAKPSTSQ